jgi:hypothetical protein
MSMPVLIGVGTVVAAIVVGLIYASLRRRDPGVIDGRSVPMGGTDARGLPTAGALPAASSADPMQARSMGPGPVDAREAMTADVPVLPPDMGPPAAAVGRSTLTVAVPGVGPQSWPLGVDQIVGRAAGAGVIVVGDPQVSRRHARITWEGGHFVYRDLGPVNPTRRNGRSLPNPYILRDGDRLHLGRSELVFRA